MIHIVTALPCEAKPLIRHYRLNGQQARHGFRIYENEQMRLIISGLGKTPCAAACAYLQALQPEQQAAWLNLGIAGHGELEVGTALLASKISEPNTDTRYYPQALSDCACPRLEVISLDQAGDDYHPQAAYDMEAAAFYATTIRFASSEVVQVIKIISDNRLSGVENISAEKTEALIASRMEQVDAVIQQLTLRNQALQAIDAASPAFEAFMHRWRFSVSQQHQLKRLLQQWQARSDDAINIDIYSALKNSKAVIQALKENISSLPYRFGDA